MTKQTVKVKDGKARALTFGDLEPGQWFRGVPTGWPGCLGDDESQSNVFIRLRDDATAVQVTGRRSFWFNKKTTVELFEGTIEVSLS